MTTGEKISYYRKNANMSQEELGNQLFVTRQTVSQWENDQTVPTVENFIRLCELFSLTMNDFFEQYENTPATNTPDPDEKYVFQYSESELDKVFSMLYRKNIFRFCIQIISLTFLLITMSVIHNTVGVFCFMFMLCGNAFAFALNCVLYRKKCKRIKVRLLRRKNAFSVFGNYLYASVYSESGELIYYERIPPENIDKTWESSTLYVFQYKSRNYILKKDIIDSESKLKQLLGF